MAETLELKRTTEPYRRRITIMVALSLAFLVVMLVFAVFGTAITPHDHEEQRLFVSDTPPSAQFWAGTDQLGRDVFSRTIIGARPALVGALTVSVGAFAIATMLGLASGYLGGAVDAGVMRWADLMLALPGLLIAIVVLFLIGVPIAFAMALTGAVGLWILEGPGPALAHTLLIPWDEGRSFVFVTIPLFVLMGQLVFQTGLASDLYAGVRTWIGKVPGGMAITSVVACASFGAVTGSSIATVATMG
ncbi:MAG: TRAP transporter large permease subunit, partial [Acidobacteria bacterium]|nr:TRAP transporter large permease subunit [Acidobacteriota bacterium]